MRISLLLLVSLSVALARGKVIDDDPCWNAAANYHVLKAEYEGRVISGQPKKVEDGCKDINNDDKKIMAALMGECRRSDRPNAKRTCLDAQKKMTKKWTESDYSELARTCLENLTDHEYDIFVQYFNHMENVCFHVQSLLWHQRTSNLIESLTSKSDEVVEKLDLSNEKQKDLINNQITTLKNQETLLDRSVKLQDVIEGGQALVQNAFEEMKLEVEHEHIRVREIFGDILDQFQRLITFQKYLKNKIIDIQSCLLYCFLCFISFYVTSSPRTSGCRPYLYVLWTLLAITEIAIDRSSSKSRRMVLTFFKIFSIDQSYDWIQNDINWSRHLIMSARIGAISIALSMWMYTIINYIDPQAQTIKAVSDHIDRLYKKMAPEDEILDNIKNFKADKHLDHDPSLSQLVKRRSVWSYIWGNNNSRDCRYRNLLANRGDIRSRLEIEHPNDFMNRVQWNALVSRMNNQLR